MATSGILAGLVLAPFVAQLGGTAWAASGCLVTFRHGVTVQADRCEDQREAIAYLRFGGWVVVLKSIVASVKDERGVTQLNSPWTAAELRAQTTSLPKEGGVPVGPTGVEPYVLPPPPPVVVYYPEPGPAPGPGQPAYEQPVYAVPVLAYPGAVASCPHCFRRRPVPHRPPFVRGKPASQSHVGPMAIPRSFSPVSPFR
jgi:hypothetical protein